MAKKLYEETNIQAIANAIREKNGQSASYKVAEMADAILAISDGEIVDTPGAILPPASSWTFSKVLEQVDSYTIDQCLFDGDVFVGSVTGAMKGAGIRSNAKIDMTDAKYLHIEFTAEGISSDNNQFCVYAKDGIGTNATEVVLDKVATSDEIAAGYMDIDVSAITGSYYLFMGLVRWRGGNAITAISKIRLDTKLGGDGNTGSSGNTVIDTSDATATENHILFPETAYVRGKKVKGSVQSRAAQTYTPGTANQVIAAGQYLSGEQTIQGDQNLVPGNIKSGVSIFGIVGSYAGSAASGGSAQSATGTMAGSGSNDMSFSVDFEPDLVCVCVSDPTAMQANAHMAGAIIVRDLFAQCAYRRASTTAFSNGNFGYDVTGLVRSTSLKASYSGGVCTVHAVQGSYKFISDCAYTWTAIKF